MSDTAFFVRPALTPAKAAAWLRLDEGVAPAGPAPRWSVPSFPDLDNITAKLAAGDDECIGVLVQHLYPSMAQLAHALMPVRQSEYELAGTMLAAVLRRLRKRPDRATNVSQWAGRLAIRQALRELKAENIGAHFHKKCQSDLALLGKLTTEEAGPSQMDHQAVRQVVARILTQFAPRQRLIIALTEIDGWTVDELAGHAGWPKWLARFRAFLARRKFQKVLEGWLARAGEVGRRPD